jgi:sulfate transport system permease protein
MSEPRSGDPTAAPELAALPALPPAVAPRRAHGQKGPAAWTLIGLALVYALLLLLGPLASLVWGALEQGLSRLYAELTTPDAIHALKLTLILSVVATVLNTVVGVAAAWLFVRDDFRGRRFLNAIVDTPFAVSPVIAGFMLILLFGRNGWLAPLADALGMKVVFALPGMLLATMFVSIPFVIREVMPVLEQMGIEQENAAQTLGASGWRTFWRVTLPGIRWGVLYGVSLTFARALGEFGALLVVSGSISGLTETSTLFIFRTLDERNTVAAYGMALVLALLSFSLLMVMEVVKRRTHRSS